MSFGQFLNNNKIIITVIIITTITTKQLKKGKINYRVFGFLRISLVTCNKNKMGISRFRLKNKYALNFGMAL